MAFSNVTGVTFLLSGLSTKVTDFKLDELCLSNKNCRQCHDIFNFNCYVFIRYNYANVGWLVVLGFTAL